MMKSIYLIAVAAASVAAPSAPAVALGASTGEDEKKVCTRAAQRGGSRVATGRVCMTPAQWRAKLGNDWRQILTGRSVEDDMDALETRAVPVEASGVISKCNPCR